MTKVLKFIKRKKYLSHSYKYDVDGEDLPKKRSRVNKGALLVAITAMLLVICVLNFIVVSYRNLFMQFGDLENPSLVDIFNSDWDSAFKVINLVTPAFDYKMYFLILSVATLIGFFIYSKLNYKSEDEIAFGQKGDSRFTRVDEIKKQYPSIPEKEKTFKGVGGVPISHFEDRFYIDVDTVNNCILGVSRSGKGEIIITPMIDILSRAEVKSSMVVNDPKGELFAGSKDTLEKRGYDVEVLNLQDPLQSMSYNPLQLVIEAWLQGNEEEAGKRANSIAYTLYNDPNAGENAFFNDAAQNTVTAIILALVEHSVMNHAPEKITMYNVAEMLNELGTTYYKENDDDFIEKNALDEYFTNLPQGHVAKKKYGSTSFAGEKARGSILATANQGLQPFVDPLFAKMTSANSIELKQIGFNKSLIGQLDKSLTNKRIDITFHRNDENKTLIGSHRVKIKGEGLYSLNFTDQLQDGDLVLIKFEDKYKLIYQIKFEKQKDKDGNIIFQLKEGNEHLPEYKRDVSIQTLVNTFPYVKKDLQMKYSDKPTAVFMIIPDYDSSNHTLASIFTKQLYTELAGNCAETKGKKCFTRVQFILDEFGNMPPIDDMDQVVTVCLGRNILFNLVIQSYSQLKRKYGEAAETIKENMQNHIYIMSTNEETIEELSKKAGHTTLISQSSNEAHLEVDNKITKSADQTRIITFDRLSQLIEGETLVIRSLHRQDVERKKVRPYPIFNTGVTNMPYRWEFLSHWLDTSRDLNDIDIHSKHTDLNLQELAVKLEDFIIHKPTKKKFIERNEVYKQSLIKKEIEKNNELSGITNVINDLEHLMNTIEIDYDHYAFLNEMIYEFKGTGKLAENADLMRVSLEMEAKDIVAKIRELIRLRELN